jgi:hypothetical protein
MSQVIKLNTIAAFDFNASRKHIYVNFINDEGQKRYVENYGTLNHCISSSGIILVKKLFIL